MTCVQRFLSGVYNSLHGYLAYYKLYLHLRQQVHIHCNAAVILRTAFLLTASEHVGHCHTGYTQLIHSDLQVFKLVLICYNNHLAHLRLFGRSLSAGYVYIRHRNRLVYVALRSSFVRRYVSCDIWHHTCRSEVCICAGKVVLCSIQTHNFLFRTYTQTYRLIYDSEYDKHRNHYPSYYYRYAKHFDSEELESAAVEYAAIDSEETCHYRTERAARAVYADRADRIVDLELLIYKLDYYNDENACAKADNRRADGRYHVAARCNSDQACQRAVQRHRYVRLSITKPCEYHCSYRSDCRCEVCIYEYHTRAGYALVARHGHRGAAVETKPAEPENKHAERAERQRMTGNSLSIAVLIIFSDTRSQHLRAYKRRYAAYHMNSCGTCKIMESQFRKPSASPNPMTGYGINNRAYAQRINAVCGKLRALCHRARYNSGRCGTEHRLENYKSPQRNPFRQYTAVISKADRRI